ncbi:MAG: hypothetical protein WBN23_15885 [Woeseia sp.]
MKFPTFSLARIFSALLLLVAAALPPGNTAQAATAPADGCTQLARVVEQSVARTLLAERAAPVAFTIAGQGAMQSCGAAAATVSHAFSTTLAEVGIGLAWNDGLTIAAGDYCQNHYLDRCYPQRIGHGHPHPVAGDAEITRAWAIVAATVRQFMPFGGRSNTVYFQPERFAASLLQSLDVTLRAPRSAAQLARSHKNDARRTAGTPPCGYAPGDQRKLKRRCSIAV